MSKRKLYLAAYDVSCPSRLNQSLQVIKGFASGGQKSVFECFLSPRERLQLLQQIEPVLDQHMDRFLLLSLTQQQPVKTLGIALPPQDPVFYYLG